MHVPGIAGKDAQDTMEEGIAKFTSETEILEENPTPLFIGTCL